MRYSKARIKTMISEKRISKDMDGDIKKINNVEGKGQEGERKEAKERKVQRMRMSLYS